MYFFILMAIVVAWLFGLVSGPVAGIFALVLFIQAYSVAADKRLQAAVRRIEELEEGDQG